MTVETERAARARPPSFVLTASLVGVLGWLCAGCLVGKVLDPVSGAGIAATVETYARCTGGACTVQGEGWQKTTASSQGDFVYNAYAETTETQAKLELANGREAFSIRVSAPGYVTRTFAHKPSYRPYVDPDTGEEVHDSRTGEQVYYTALPQTLYLCPEQDAADSDGDTLCDVVENKYGTDPYNPDSDYDGLDDGYELFGDEQLDLAGYGADPLRRDIFLEVDYYAGNELSDDAVHRLEQAFEAAPPAPESGPAGIRLHVLRDDLISGADADPDLTVLTLNYWAEFDRIKNKYAKKHRQPAFHYTVLANLHDGITGGVSRGIPGHDFIVALSGFSQDDYAATIMHELGHNLGLNHGGPPTALQAWKPNYLSIMSYQYAYSGVIRDGQGVLDYSRHAVDQVTEKQLNEVTAMSPAPGSSTTEADLARYGIKIGVNVNPLTQFGTELALNGSAGQNLDFNRDGIFSASVQADLNGNGNPNDVFPASQVDWDFLKYRGHVLGGGTIGVQRPDQVEAQSEEEFVEPDACPPHGPSL